MATAIKLDKAQRAELEKFRKSLRESEDAVTDAVAEYERRCESAREELIPVLEKHNELLAEVKEFASNVAAVVRDAIDERSEKWQESDKGTAAEEFQSSWEGYDPDEYSIPDEVLVEEIDSSADALDELQEEPEEE